MVKEEKNENEEDLIKKDSVEEDLKEEEVAKVMEEAVEAEETTSQSAEDVVQAEALAMERLLRLQADFENFKKRTQKEKTEIYQFALEGMMTKLLPVLDNLERAESVASEETISGYREGVQMVFKQLMSVLNDEGLKEIETENCTFDPNYHHGVAVGDDSEKDDQSILEVFQKGYVFKEKVIRPAMVKVNQI